MPVVIVLHGGGGNARQMARYTRFDEEAEKQGFAVVYPETVDGNWNDGRDVSFLRAQRENIDDVKFIRQTIDDVARQIAIDRSRVFATGISNGGFMSNRLAAEASDLVAGVAPVCGGMAPAIAEEFQPRFPVSAMIIQGDADPIIPVAGGEVVMGRGRARGTTVPAAEVLAKYVTRNGNPPDPAQTTLDADPADGTSVDIVKYGPGTDGARTELYLVKGGGHAWPGRPRYAPEWLIGKASQEFSATRVIWEFFKACPPRGVAR
jgi:polyhydroxybutyrate depolymerase